MELIKQLEDLQNNNQFDKEHISEIINEDALLLKLREKIISITPQYNTLYDLFEIIRNNAFEEGGINVFQEYLSIKLVYLQEVYNFDRLFTQALIALIGPVYLDFIIDNDFLAEDTFYKFFMKRYEDFKHNNELSILKMLKELDFSKLSVDNEQLLSVLGDIQKYIPKEDLK